MEGYDEALSIGQKQFKQAVRMNINPYPAVLSDILKDAHTEGEINIGTMEIPMNLIVGTKEKGRSNAFSRGFYPLLAEGSEFAGKWSALLESQMEEGIRDAIKAYEYKNRFYVEEGNKRVSVGKYMKMPTILATVIRVLPEKNDTLESKKYYEYVRFFEKTHMCQILFSKYGSYEKMLKLLGKTWDEDWADDELEYLDSVYYHFSEDFLKLNPDAEPEKIGDGFLAFLEIIPYSETKNKTDAELKEAVRSMKKELKGEAADDEVHRVLEPEEIKPSLVDKILPTGMTKVRAAFIYDEDPKNSDWIYAHELGRQHVEEVFGDKVVTTVYSNAKDSENLPALLENAVLEGNRVIFTTAPGMMTAAIKTALKYPNVYFFNCSVNFPYKTVEAYYARMYEAKFLTGLIAGALSGTEDIGYEAGYPIYGTVAEINAFALGVQMVNPRAKVRLSWTSTKDPASPETNHDGMVISAKENITSSEGQKNYGLYRQEGDKKVRYAAAVINWGRFYEQILDLIMKGTLKTPSKKGARTINYWWGMSSDVIDVVCSKNIPARLRKLVELFHGLLQKNEYHPFEGEIVDQNGKIHGAEESVLSTEEIVTMKWLCNNVVGSIPDMSELTEKGAALAEIQGVQWEES